VEYEPRGFILVDVNKNSTLMLVDGVAYLFETSTKNIVLGCHYSIKRVQENYDEIYGVKSRVKRKVLTKLEEGCKKEDFMWKNISVVVRVTYEKHYALALGKLGKKPVENMIERIRDD